jgi:hypothetical protein
VDDTVTGRARERLAHLQSELREGETQLRELNRQEMALRETMLRISGAVQVLQELLEAPDPTANGATGADAVPDTVLTVP